MKSMYRKIAVAALGGVLLCGTAACSGSSDTGSGKSADGGKSAASRPVEVSPAAAVKRAADNNEKVTSMSYTMKGKVPGEGAIEGEASMSMKPLALQMRMSGEFGGKKADVEIRLFSDGMYLNAGKEAAAEMNGKTWMKFPTEALSEGKDSPLGGLGSQADQNPAAESASLTAADDLKKVGEENVDGVRTTHYTGTLVLADLRKGLAGEDAATKKNREKSLKAYEAMGLDKLTMDMWVDGNDRTKQFRTRGTAEKGPLDMTIKFLDYNKPVEVKTPPASETVDLAELMKGADTGTESG